MDLVYTIDKSFLACKINWILLDATRFLQVLVNLLNNAVKFTQRATTRKVSVTLGASTSRPTEHDFGVRLAPVPYHTTLTDNAAGEGVYLSVSVSDTGPGMSSKSPLWTLSSAAASAVEIGQASHVLDKNSALSVSWPQGQVAVNVVITLLCETAPFKTMETTVPSLDKTCKFVFGEGVGGAS